jgi:hypothetical protein
MENKMCRGLFKFFSREGYRDDFLKGHLYFNSLNYFRKVEASDVFGQNDPYECCKIFQPNSIKVFFGQLELKDLAGPVSICYNEDVLKSYIMCFSTIRFDSQKQYASLDDLKRDVLFSEKMINYGKHAVVIPRMELFVERLKKAALKKNLDFAMGPVNYYDFAKDNVLDEYPKNAFRKRREFSYQREFRFLLRKKDAVNEYVTLEVGDLSDIAQSCKSADLNGMLEINAG